MLFGWGDHLTRAEKDRVKTRLTFIGLSSIVGLVLLLVGGTLLWDKVYLAQRPVLRVDGAQVSLRDYANVLAYQKNNLELQFFEASRLASQPPPPGTDPSQNFYAQIGQQRMGQIQAQLSGLAFQLTEDLIDERLIRAEAARRGLSATQEEVDTEIKQIIGYQDLVTAATPGPTVEPTPVSTPANAEAGVATQPTQPPEPAPSATAASSTPAATAAPTRTPRQNRSDTFDARDKDYQRLTGASDSVIRGQIEYQVLRRELNDEMAKSAPTTGEQIRARHILVAEEALARTALDRIRAGESFEAVAAELSTDTSNNTTGGDLGWFGRGAMVGEFETAAFAVPAGQLSEPVKTQFGWHIIRVDERDPNRPLEGQALEVARNGVLDNWLDEEKEKHQIERLLTADMVEWAERNGRRPSTAR
jgi:parvulin-like peptidyl-prolyl isomerase